MENSEKQLLYRIKLVQLELARDRGYDTTNEDKNVGSFDSFDAYYTAEAKRQDTSFREALTAFYESKLLTGASIIGVSNPTQPTVDSKMSDIKMGTVEELYNKPALLLVYYGPSSGGQSTTMDIFSNKKRNFTQFYQLKGTPTQSILVVPSGINPQAEEKLMKLVQPDRANVQVMTNFNLSFNPTKHVFVPRHELLPLGEARDFLQKGHMTMGQLPIIRRDDPIVSYFGALPGRIFRIYRQPLFLETLPEITYRRVANIDMPVASQSKADSKTKADARK